MRVEVRFFATLRRHALPGSAGITYAELADGASVADLMRHVGVDAAEVHLIMVNGIQTSDGQILMDADRVGLFPPVGGG